MNNSFIELQGNVRAMAGLGRQSTTGFYELDCPVCASLGKKRQGGFKFESDKIIWNCFSASCDSTCVYELGQPVSKRFKSLMGIFGVRIPADLRAVRNSLQKRIEQELKQELYKEHTYKQIKIPPEFVPLTEIHRTWWGYYLDRRVDPSGFYFIKDGIHRGATAIPMYFYSKLIGFQIAFLNNRVKYLNYTENNTHPILLPEKKIPETPILVEGVLDAYCFPNTVGILSGKISKEQAYQIRGRECLVFPDRHSGEKMLETAKKYGWKVIIPPWRNVGDMNDCVVTYGVLATARMIVDNTYSDYNKANIAYKLWAHQKEI